MRAMIVASSVAILTFAAWPFSVGSDKPKDRLVHFRKAVEVFDRKGEISELTMVVKDLDELCCVGIVCTDSQWEKLARRQKEIGVRFVIADG